MLSIYPIPVKLYNIHKIFKFVETNYHSVEKERPVKFDENLTGQTLMSCKVITDLWHLALH